MLAGRPPSKASGRRLADTRGSGSTFFTCTVFVAPRRIRTFSFFSSVTAMTGMSTTPPRVSIRWSPRRIILLLWLGRGVPSKCRVVAGTMAGTVTRRPGQPPAGVQLRGVVVDGVDGFGVEPRFGRKTQLFGESSPVGGWRRDT